MLFMLDCCILSVIIFLSLSLSLSLFLNNEERSKNNIKIRDTVTRVSLLSIAFLAAASVTPRRIYAILLAQVIPGGAFIQISTANTVRIQDETRRA